MKGTEVALSITKNNSFGVGRNSKVPTQSNNKCHTDRVPYLEYKRPYIKEVQPKIIWVQDNCTYSISLLVLDTRIL